MQYRLHIIANVLADINTMAGSGNYPILQTNDMRICEQIADYAYKEVGHGLNYVVVYDNNGKLCKILRSPFLDTPRYLGIQTA